MYYNCTNLRQTAVNPDSKADEGRLGSGECAGTIGANLETAHIVIHTGVKKSSPFHTKNLSLCK